MKRHIKGLFCSKDGLISQSKFWNNVGAAVATYIVITMANSGNLSVDIFLAYCGILVSPNVILKLGYILKGQNNQQNYYSQQDCVDNQPMREYTPTNNNSNVDRPE